MQDTRNIQGGIWDENSLAESGCSHFKRICGIVLKLMVGCGI